MKSGIADDARQLDTNLHLLGENEMNATTFSAIAKRLRTGIWIVSAATFIFAVACGEGGGASAENRDDSFEVGAAPRLVVQGENGSIIVRPSADDVIRVQAVLQRPNRQEYSVNQAGGTITVTVEQKSSFWNFNRGPQANIEITAPAATRVELRNSNGSVEVHGMQRSGNIRSSNGAITVEDVSGEFEIETSKGEVTAVRAVGTFQIKTSNGEIEFDGELVAGGDNLMRSSNGSVDVKLQETPSVELDASTSNGSRTTELPILTSSTGDEDHLTGTIGNGEAKLVVKTSNGSITIL